MSFGINIKPGIRPLLLNEIVLLLETLRLCLPDLLLAELGIIVVVLAHSVQIMFDLFLLSTHLFNSGQLLVSEVFVSEVDLLLLLLLALSHCLLVSFSLCLTLLLLSLLHQHSIVVLILKLLQLSRLLLRLFDLLHGTHLFILEHSNAVPKQLDVTLQLQTDGSCLVEGQVFTFNVNDNVWAYLTVSVLALSSLAHVGALAAFRLSKGVASL